MEHKHQDAVRTMCRVLDLSVNGYYCMGTESAKSSRTREPETIGRNTRNSPKQSSDLWKYSHCQSIAEKGFAVQQHRAARLMQRMGIRAKPPEGSRRRPI
jgi:hypothetical protein